MINIVREDDGVFANGTIWILDGSAKATWTFHQDGGQFTNERELDDEEFDPLWADLNEPVFARNRVRRADEQLDFRTNYVVGVIFDVDGQAGQVTHLIPAAEPDPTWLRWLRRVEATQRPG